MLSSSIFSDHYLIDVISMQSHYTIQHMYWLTCIAYVLSFFYLLQISFRDDGETKKPWMVTSHSFDNLNDINRDESYKKKKEGGGNILLRIFKIRTLQSPARKKTANKQKSKKKASSNRSSLGHEALAVPGGGESSLANSLSMPDIAGESVFNFVRTSTQNDCSQNSMNFEAVQFCKLQLLWKNSV